MSGHSLRNAACAEGLMCALSVPLVCPCVGRKSTLQAHRGGDEWSSDGSTESAGAREAACSAQCPGLGQPRRLPRASSAPDGPAAHPVTGGGLTARSSTAGSSISGLKINVSGRQAGVMVASSRQNPSIRSPHSRNDQPSRSCRDGAGGPRPSRGAAEREEAVQGLVVDLRWESDSCSCCASDRNRTGTLPTLRPPPWGH
jgi:hypothetical protein